MLAHHHMPLAMAAKTKGSDLPPGVFYPGQPVQRYDVE